MKKWAKLSLVPGVACILIAAWMVYFHNEAVIAKLPNWAWLQNGFKHLAPTPPPAADDDDDPDTSQNEIPVHVARITVETLHHYVEGFGNIAPSPPRLGQMPGSANIASPIAGVVATVNCQVGQKVHAGDALLQLDDRLAKSAADQASAALAQAEASLAALQAPPKAQQVRIAELAVEKAKSAADFATKNLDRVTRLAADQGASAKALEQATQDLAAAQNDLAVNQKQLELLKSPPTTEMLNQELAKVGQARAALATAQTQLKMMTVAAPIDATVVAVSINPGEAVDPAKTLVTLIAMDRLTVDMDIPADQLPADVAGMLAEILPTSTAASDDATPVIGEVAVVAPDVDPHNGAITLSIDLPKDAGLRPGLSVRVRIIAGAHKDCMAVPLACLSTDENGASVIAVVDGDLASRKSVTPGYAESGLVEISPFAVEKTGGKMEEINAQAIGKGLIVQVVTAGAFGLPQATRVKIEK